MKFIYKIMTLFCLLASCVGCETELKKAPLPSFDIQIEPNENILFFDDSVADDGLNEIIAFDTKESKILYKYSFGYKNSPNFELLYDLVYDYETDKENIYIVFGSGRTAKLNISTGKMYEFENIELIREPESLTVFNNEVWVSPNYPGFKNRPVKYFVYTPATNTSRYEELPEGILLNATPFEMNDKVFLPLYMDEPQIYNYTDNKMLDISSLDDDLTYLWHDYYNGFLASALWKYDEYEDTQVHYADIYKIESILPNLKIEKIFTSKPYRRICGIYETEQFLFICNHLPSSGELEIRDKNTYEIKDSIPLKTESPFANFVRDNFFYCVKDDTHGIYKISLEDFTVKEIQ